MISIPSKDGKYQLTQITRDNLDDALNVIRLAFFPYENVSRATDVYKHPAAMQELEELSVRAARDGVSVVAVERSSGKIVSAFFNKLQVAAAPDEPNYFQVFETQCSQASSRGLVRFMIDVEDKFDVFREKNVSCGMEIMFIATMPEYRGQKIGTQLWKLSMDIAQHLKNGRNVKIPLDEALLPLEPKPQFVMALGTSNVTNKIAQRFHFETLLEVNYDEFTFQGRKFSNVIGEETLCSTFLYYQL